MSVPARGPLVMRYGSPTGTHPCRRQTASTASRSVTVSATCVAPGCEGGTCAPGARPGSYSSSSTRWWPSVTVAAWMVADVTPVVPAVTSSSRVKVRSRVKPSPSHHISSARPRWGTVSPTWATSATGDDGSGGPPTSDASSVGVLLWSSVTGQRCQARPRPVEVRRRVRCLPVRGARSPRSARRPGAPWLPVSRQRRSCAAASSACAGSRPSCRPEHEVDVAEAVAVADHRDPAPVGAAVGLVVDEVRRGRGAGAHGPAGPVVVALGGVLLARADVGDLVEEDPDVVVGARLGLPLGDRLAEPDVLVAGAGPGGVDVRPRGSGAG